MQHVYEYSFHFMRWLLGSLIGDTPPLTEGDTPSSHAVEHMADRSHASSTSISLAESIPSPSPGASTPTTVPSTPQVGSVGDNALEDTSLSSLDLLTRHDDPRLRHREVIEDQQNETELPPAASVRERDMGQEGTDGSATPTPAPESTTIQQLSEPVSKDHTSHDSHPTVTLMDFTTLSEPCVDQSRPRRDEELWFEDGSLICVAGDIEFQVYKGPLVAQSGLFKNMLSLPRSGYSTPANSSNSPSYPTICLPEAPEDVRHFLRVFAQGTLRFEPTFNEISACIRLGHKYQCEKLTQQCLAYLRKYYPDIFDLWLQVDSLDPPSFLPIHRIGVVNLARLTGADYLLPVALMRCCMLGPEIGQGFEREDGTRETLSIEDLTRCVVGRAFLFEATLVAAHRALYPTVADGCTNPERCTSALQYLLSEMVANESVMQDVRQLRFDFTYSWYANMTEQGRALCSKCYPLVGRSGRPAGDQRDIFKRLPELMGVTVEGWCAETAE